MSDSSIPTHRRILLVDDHPAIHDDYRKVFGMIDCASEMNDAEAELFGSSEASASQISFEIDSAYQGKEALEKVREATESGRPYAMAFVDMRMPPGWDGLQTTVRLWTVNPDLQVVICTAHSDYSWEDMVACFGSTDRIVLLKKPFDPLEVLQLAHSLTEKWRLLQEARVHRIELETRVAERTRELHAANEKLQREITERAQVEEALRQSQKMEAVGHLAGGIAHDFNNLLSVIRGHTGLLLGMKDFPSKGVEESLREVDSAAERAASLTRQLLTFSRKQIMQPQDLDLNEVIGHVGKLLRRLLGETIALEIDSAAKCPLVHADRAMIEQVVLNLAVNARDAMPRGGRVRIVTKMVTLADGTVPRHPLARAGRFAAFSVIDDGSGIAPEVMPRLFEPFFTTKDVGKGTGLGLATVYGIMAQHQGWVEVESTLGHGATFTVFLPEIESPAEELPRHLSNSTATGGTETILLVEDEGPLLNITRMVLQNYGYQVFSATSGVEALKMWPECAAQVDLLITDVVMPEGLSGPELATRLKSERPELKVIFNSGYSRDLMGRDGVVEEGTHFLTKPYTPMALATAIRDCLDGKPYGAAAAA